VNGIGAAVGPLGRTVSRICGKGGWNLRNEFFVVAAIHQQYIRCSQSPVSLGADVPLYATARRGRSFSTRLKDIEIAQKNSRLTRAQFRQNATETIVEVQRAYWDLVFARQSLTIQNETLRDFGRDSKSIGAGLETACLPRSKS